MRSTIFFLLIYLSQNYFLYSQQHHITNNSNIVNTKISVYSDIASNEDNDADVSVLRSHNTVKSPTSSKAKETKPTTKNNNCAQKISGTIKDGFKNSPLSNAEVTLFTGDNKLITKSNTGHNGAYEFLLKCYEPYVIEVSHQEYNKRYRHFELKQTTKNEIFNFYLDKIKVLPNLQVNSTLELPKKPKDRSLVFNRNKEGKVVIDVPGIFYEYDQIRISDETKKALNKIVFYMGANPDLEIEIASHTDVRGLSEINLSISEQRAAEIKKYLIEKDIDENRITYKGYGDANPLNNCNKYNKCSEEEHQLNRRIDFIVKRK